ncbi:MAG: hypothetical protein ACRDD8_14790 [Bacteroidales bacterium]
MECKIIDTKIFESLFSNDEMGGDDALIAKRDAELEAKAIAKRKRQVANSKAAATKAKNKATLIASTDLRTHVGHPEFEKCIKTDKLSPKEAIDKYIEAGAKKQQERLRQKKESN